MFSSLPFASIVVWPQLLHNTRKWEHRAGEMWGLAGTGASEKAVKTMRAGPAAEGRQGERRKYEIEGPLGNGAAHVMPPAPGATGHFGCGGAGNRRNAFPSQV